MHCTQALGAGARIPWGLCFLFSRMLMLVVVKTKTEGRKTLPLLQGLCYLGRTHGSRLWPVDAWPSHPGRIGQDRDAQQPACPSVWGLRVTPAGRASPGGASSCPGWQSQRRGHSGHRGDPVAPTPGCTALGALGRSTDLWGWSRTCNPLCRLLRRKRDASRSALSFARHVVGASEKALGRFSDVLSALRGSC